MYNCQRLLKSFSIFAKWRSFSHRLFNLFILFPFFFFLLGENCQMTWCQCLVLTVKFRQFQSSCTIEKYIWNGLLKCVRRGTIETDWGPRRLPAALWPAGLSCVVLRSRRFTKAPPRPHRRLVVLSFHCYVKRLILWMNKSAWPDIVLNSAKETVSLA